MRSGLDASQRRAVATKVCGAAAVRPLKPREVALKELYRATPVWQTKTCHVHCVVNVHQHLPLFELQCHVCVCAPV